MNIHTEKNQEIVLILPDLHHRVDQATKIIHHVGADKVIVLGDFYDDFDDTPEMVTHTSEWLIDFVANPNHIALIGNHDSHYMYPDRIFRCSGYEQWKYLQISDIVPRSTWNKLKWFHLLDNKWLLSHGGLHKFNLPDSIKKFHADRPTFFAKIDDYLNTEIVNGFRDSANNKSSWIFNAGYARWGSQRVGGITWCDHDSEMSPITGLNQIYGHTAQKSKPSWLIQDENNTRKVPSSLFTFITDEKTSNPNNSYNLCLDVYGNTHYAIWNGKSLSIESYTNL